MNTDMRARQAYEALAPVYDQLTKHHRYGALMDELLPALELQGLPSQGRLLDVGCGTGKSFLPMLDRGWAVTACDISSAMAEAARSKTSGMARIEVADMRDLPEFGQFELIWVLSDGMNYLLEVEELEAALRGLRQNLLHNGLLLFDATTLLGFRDFFSTGEEVTQDGNLRLVRRGLTDPKQGPGSTWSLEFEAEIDGNKLVETHRHLQRHYSEAEYRSALDTQGFEVLDVAGQHKAGIGLQRPLDESRHTKAIYIARPRCN